MKSNDIKKGMRMRLNNGWFATMLDNRRGNIRLMEVEGYATDVGSQYVWDIHSVEVDGKWESVDLTPKQIKDRNRIKALGF